MNIRLRKLSAAAAVLIILCAIFSSCTAVQSAYTPSLYRVQSQNGASIYLFGSIHIGDQDTYPLPETVMNAYNDSGYLAVECDIIAYESDIAAVTQTAQTMMCEPGKRIYDYVGEENYNAAVQLLEAFDLYYEEFDYFLPAFWISMLGEIPLELSQLDTEKGIDRFFLQNAKEHNKPILEIESVQEQMQMQLNYSMSLQKLLFEQSLLNPTAQGLAMKLMYESWRQGNQSALTGEMDYELQDFIELYGEYEGGLYYEYYYELGEKRNIKMADTAELYLNEGKDVFYVVGAAHMGGKKGIISLLEQRGYTVEKIEYRN